MSSHRKEKIMKMMEYIFISDTIVYQRRQII